MKKENCTMKVLTLGESILIYRRRSGISRRSVGIQIGVSARTVRSWEEGTRFPSPENLNKLGKMLSQKQD